MGQTVEHFFVQTFVSELTVEAFDEAVLLGFTGRDIVPVDADLRLPPQDGFAGKLCPVAIVARTNGATITTHLRLSRVCH